MPADLDHGLLAGVIASPDDDGPRMVMADWLEKRGQSERAEFIRVQCELARLQDPVCPVCRSEKLIPHRVTSTPWLTRCSECSWCHGPFWLDTDTRMKHLASLRRRERELWELGCSYWFAEFPGCVALAPGHECNLPSHGFSSRGFISSITCSADDFLRVAPDLIWHPQQTRECPECGTEAWQRGHLLDTKDCTHCLDAAGKPTGRLPREMPKGCQPLELVRLTTWPDPVRFGATSDTCEMGWNLSREFAGINFELPAAGVDMASGRDWTVRTPICPDCGTLAVSEAIPWTNLRGESGVRRGPMYCPQCQPARV